MEANELRIGNWVTVDNPQCYPELKNKPVRVRGIGVALGLDDKWTYGICISTDDIRYSGISQFIHFVIPIPLTEGLLLKCGFVKADCFYYTYRCSFTLWYDNFNDGSYNALSGTNHIARNIKYLHQLQNLYYALTGKELEVQL